MSYVEDLDHKILNRNQWPMFSKPEFLHELKDVADNAFESNTTEGFLASVLIYQQICEEMVRLLIRCSHFFVKISISPAEIHFEENTNETFGKLLGELNSCINFSGKTEIINNCSKLNIIRVEMIHKLILKDSLDEIISCAKKFRNIFNKIENIFFDESYDEFMVMFHDLSKDIGSDFMMELVDWDK